MNGKKFITIESNGFQDMRGGAFVSSKAVPARLSTRSRLKWGKYLKRYWTLYLLLLLPIAFFTLFRYVPMSYILLAFKKNNILQPPWKVAWAKNSGFEWFIKAFSNRDFLYALKNTLTLNLLDLVIGSPAPIIMALLLNELAFKRFKRVTQTILYLPHFLSWIIISGLSLRLLADTDGLVNIMLKRMGLSSIPFLSDPTHWVATYIFLGIWKECGWNTIIYLAALTSISPELYEAAEVDGCNRIRRIISITIPCIMPTIITMLLLKIGGLMSSGYEKIILMYNPASYETADTLSTYSYRAGILDGKLSLSTMIGLFNSVCNLVLLTASNWFSKKFSDTSLY